MFAYGQEQTSSRLPTFRNGIVQHGLVLRQFHAMLAKQREKLLLGQIKRRMAGTYAPNSG